MGKTEEREVDLTWLLPSTLLALMITPVMLALSPIIWWLALEGAVAIVGFFNPEAVAGIVIPKPGAPEPKPPMETI